MALADAPNLEVLPGVPEKLQETPEKRENQLAHGSPMDFINSARNATEKEHKMTLLEGIKTYPKAIAWSMLISTCIVMEGYDVCLINNFCEFDLYLMMSK
jgi:MFS transporter, SP family, general alpha glucoside:H+ symporter